MAGTALFKTCIVLVSVSCVLSQVLIPNWLWYAQWVHKFAAASIGGLGVFPIFTYAKNWNSFFGRYTWYYVRFMTWLPPGGWRNCYAKVRWTKPGNKFIEFGSINCF